MNQALAMKQVDPARDTVAVDAFLTTSASGLKVVSEDDYTEGQYVVGATASEVVGQKERTGEDGEGDTQRGMPPPLPPQTGRGRARTLWPA